jgi:hypothetical protein
MPILTLALSFLTSRAGPIIIALVAGLFVGWWRTDASWSQWEKGQEALRKYNQQVELAREAQNAVEIAAAATQRAEDDAAELDKLRQQVADFDKGETNAKDPCVIDDRFLDASGKLRQPKPQRHPARVTKPPK